MGFQCAGSEFRERKGVKEAEVSRVSLGGGSVKENFVS